MALAKDECAAGTLRPAASISQLCSTLGESFGHAPFDRFQPDAEVVRDFLVSHAAEAAE